MILALILFALIYILMLALPQQRPFVALGGSLTPIGASANIAAIGILRKNGETVRTKDFLRIGIPFTLAAVLTGYGCLWLVWGVAPVCRKKQRRDSQL